MVRHPGRSRRVARAGAAAILLLGVIAAGGCGSEETRPEVAVFVEDVLLDEETESPVVVLREESGTRRLPIWIGFAEADSIASQLRDEHSLRPNTHDLAKRLVEGMEARIERVVVVDLRDGIYFARIHLAPRERNGDAVEIDARPSDAIAIALRVGAPLFVSEPLLEARRERGAPRKPPERSI